MASANRKKNKATFKRHVVDPLWFKGIEGQLAGKSKPQLKYIANIIDVSLKGKNTRILQLGEVQRKAAEVIDAYDKEWKKKLNRFKKCDVNTFNRFCRCNHSDFIISPAIHRIMVEQKATVKDLLTSSMKRDGNNKKSYEFTKAEDDRLNDIADIIYKQELSYTLSFVKKNPLLDAMEPSLTPQNENDDHKQQQSRPAIQNNNALQNNNNEQQQRPAIQNNNPLQNNNNNEEKQLDVESRLIEGETIEKGSLKYNYIRKHCNLILLREQTKDNPYHRNIISNKFGTQTCTNNRVSMYRQVQLSGKACFNLIVHILFVMLGIMNFVEASEIQQVADRLNEKIRDDDQDNEEEEQKQQKGGHGRYFMERQEVHTTYDEFETDEEKDEWKKDIDFWNLNLVTYTAEYFGQDAMARGVEIGYIVEESIPQQAADVKKSNSKNARLARLKKLRK